MANPFEFREVMRAAFRVNETRTVEQVTAEHERRHKDQSDAMVKARKLMGAKETQAREPPPLAAPPPSAAMEELQALFAQAAAVQGESSNIPPQ